MNLEPVKFERQRFKQQVTVRIDKDLMKAVLACAESKGIRLTDAIEEALPLWLEKQGVTPPLNEYGGEEE